MAKPLVVFVGDTHIGGFTSLFPPRFELSDHNLLLPSPVQQTLYTWWLEFWREVWHWRQGRYLIVVHLGDVVDGQIKNTPQALTSLADQERCAVQVLLPARNLADEWHQLAGTEAHVGKGWEAESRVARELGATTFGPELSLEVDGVLFDLSHHTRLGARPWTSSAVNVVAEVVQNCALFDLPIPRYVVRGHTHRVDDSGETNPRCRAFIVPCWQLRNAYGYKHNSFRRPDVGGVIVDGEAVIFRRFYGHTDQHLVYHAGDPHVRPLFSAAGL